MSVRTARITRKVKRNMGGILDSVLHADVPVKRGSPVVVDGVRYVELEDGRLAVLPEPRIAWRIANGRVVREKDMA